MTRDEKINCSACRDGLAEPFAFSMAFQPIVNVATGKVFAYEALARGPQNEPASTVLGRVNEANRYAFDQTCRVKAIGLASKLGMQATGAKLSVNFMPGAVYSPAACIRHTLKASAEYQFPMDRLIFEITEDERVDDSVHLQTIVTEYRKHGFAIAIDDFGSGYSGLNLLAHLGADIVKLDGELVRDIDKRPRAEEIVRATVALCRRLRTTLVAERIETAAECAKLQMCGVTLMQGYLFARPEFEALPEVQWSNAPLLGTVAARLRRSVPGEGRASRSRPAFQVETAAG